MRRRIFRLAIPAALAACGSITGDFDRIIAIELDLSVRTLEVGDTTTLKATALDASGDSVPGAQIIWRVLDVDTGQIGFALDSLTGFVTGLEPSSARVQARIDNLRSGPITVSITAAPDSIGPGPSGAIITATRTDIQTPPIQVQVFDLTTSPGEQLGLTGKPATYTLPFGPEPSVFLSIGDTIPLGDGSTIGAVTSGSGVAAAFLRTVSGNTPPDTVFVDVEVTTATGRAVAGSPLRFVVLFQDAQ